MVWTYSGDPLVSDQDAIRFEIGDTDEDDQLLQDEEIRYALKVEDTILAAAARCCEVIARKLSRDTDYRLGPAYVYASQRARAFMELAAELRRRAGSGSGMYVGGTGTRPAFTRRMMDNVGAGEDGSTT